ncbi:hypothetical protein APA_5160 [Pseudanabaena sp. lw0831]|nr:hypothetical protein APA_5160 [Pseudanabaena sp. lw0831]
MLRTATHLLGFIYIAIVTSNSHYETDFGVSSAKGAGNTKIGFLKTDFYMRIAV